MTIVEKIKFYKELIRHSKKDWIELTQEDIDNDLFGIDFIRDNKYEKPTRTDD